MANESSKLFLFSGMVFSTLSEKGLGQGGPALKHTASCLDGIMRNRLNGNLSLVHQGDEDLPPRLEPDLFADRGGNDDLAFRKSFNNWHRSLPYHLNV